MSTLFGLAEREVVSAAGPLLSRAGLKEDRASLRDLFSRSVWSRLVEPGDGFAGRIVNALGSARALEMLLSRPTADDVLREIAGGDSITDLKTLTETLSRWQARLSSQISLRDFAFARKDLITLLTPSSPYWPKGFNDLDVHAPFVLWTKGDVTLFSQPSLAVVGSRAATAYGENVTAELVTATARRGYVIVSGGAYGIDGVAHRTCLATSQKTVAFLAGGVDRLYPAGHEALFQHLAEQGLLCAELPPGSSPTKWRFLQRNRLIAAATQATLVCEAGHRSGSLNTAGHAAQLGRALGAVPGPVTSAASAGCHRLLRDYDAVCIRNVNDVLELLGHDAAVDAASTLPGESSRQRRVLDALSTHRSADVERIASIAGLSSTQVSESLVELELLQLVQSTRSGWKKATP